MNREQLMENLETYKRGLNDTFQFHCTECGACCRNREDIILSPHDLFRAAKATKTTPEIFFTRYCETFIGMTSQLPIVHVRMGLKGECMLLHDKHCIIHKAKPSVCAMFPVGRTVSLPENAPDSAEVKIQYFLQPIECGDASETHTIRDWIESFGLEPDDPAYGEWCKFITSISPTMRELRKILPRSQMDVIWSVVFVFAYLNYDTNQEFLPQFQKNAAAVKSALAKAKGDIK